MKFKVSIKGIAPILQHRFSEDDLIKVTKKTGDKKLTDAEKRKAAEHYAYFSGKKIVQPALHVVGLRWASWCRASHRVFITVPPRVLKPR